jgi:hypothetical protein
MKDLPIFIDWDPTGPDPDVEARFTGFENMLEELLLRSPVELPKSHFVPVLDPRPPSPNEVDRGLDIVVRNRRFCEFIIHWQLSSTWHYAGTSPRSSRVSVLGRCYH